MSFDGFQETIQDGDNVILYVSFKQILSIVASAHSTGKKGQRIDNVLQTPYGALRCADLIGQKFGARINLARGHVHVLKPTPELWTLSLPHRTQIIYTPDISMILLQLELHPGSVVVESGTGSASLSHALIRTIKPNGHLYTFDFHEERANTAREEFQEHGFGKYVTVAQRDVCTNGFGLQDEVKADAVFLDLPHPWLAVSHAIDCFKPQGGRICSFSPCIEQVQKTCLALSELGFVEIKTLELLHTEYLVQNRQITCLDFDFLKTAKEVGVDESQAKEEKKVNEKKTVRTLTAVPPESQTGHTGYLTFATLPPFWARHDKFMTTDDQIDDDDSELGVNECL